MRKIIYVLAGIAVGSLSAHAFDYVDKSGYRHFNFYVGTAHSAVRRHRVHRLPTRTRVRPKPTPAVLLAAPRENPVAPIQTQHCKPIVVYEAIEDIEQEQQHEVEQMFARDDERAAWTELHRVGSVSFAGALRRPRNGATK